jgi:hypothetical protein
MDALDFYCMVCSAAPGTPCSDPLAGYETPRYHAWRVRAAQDALARGGQ